MRIIKMTLVAFVCLLGTTNCAVIDEDINKKITSETTENVPAETEVNSNENYTPTSIVFRNIVISDDILKVHSDHNDLAIIDVKIYDEFNAEVLQDPGCLLVECTVDEAKVNLLPNDDYTVILTFVNTKTYAQSTRTDNLTIARP